MTPPYKKLVEDTPMLMGGAEKYNVYGKHFDDWTQEAEARYNKGYTRGQQEDALSQLYAGLPENAQDEFDRASRERAIGQAEASALTKQQIIKALNTPVPKNEKEQEQAFISILGKENLD